MESRNYQELRQSCSKLLVNVEMASYSTLRAGGRAEALVEVHNLEQLLAVLQWLGRNQVDYRVIGGGSNLLFASPLFAGVYLKLGGDFCIIKEEQSNIELQKHDVRVGAGCSLARFISWCTERTLTGMEFAVGIPGTIGGAITMNAGASDREISEHLQGLVCVTPTGVIQELGLEDMDFSYRKSSFRSKSLTGGIIVEAHCLMAQGEGQQIRQQCAENLRARKMRQPKLASAGSFFKNPPGDFAGRLIEGAGLKGFKVGNAMVSIEHGNFLVNAGNASAEDVLALMKVVQAKVYEHSGVQLEPEVHIF